MPRYGGFNSDIPYTAGVSATRMHDGGVNPCHLAPRSGSLAGGPKTTLSGCGCSRLALGSPSLPTGDPIIHTPGMVTEEEAAAQAVKQAAVGVSLRTLVFTVGGLYAARKLGWI